MENLDYPVNPNQLDVLINEFRGDQCRKASLYAEMRHADDGGPGHGRFRIDAPDFRM